MFRGVLCAEDLNSRHTLLDLTAHFEDYLKNWPYQFFKKGKTFSVQQRGNSIGGGERTTPH